MILIENTSSTRNYFMEECKINELGHKAEEESSVTLIIDNDAASSSKEGISDHIGSDSDLLGALEGG